MRVLSQICLLAVLACLAVLSIDYVTLMVTQNYCGRDWTTVAYFDSNLLTCFACIRHTLLQYMRSHVVMIGTHYPFITIYIRIVIRIVRVWLESVDKAVEAL